MVVPIWKKGNKRKCTSYRGISLLSHAGKMYAKILKHRTGYIVEPYHSDAQFGFRKGRGCTDAILAIWELSEKANEHSKDLHIILCGP